MFSCPYLPRFHTNTTNLELTLVIFSSYSKHLSFHLMVLTMMMATASQITGGFPNSLLTKSAEQRKSTNSPNAPNGSPTKIFTKPESPQQTKPMPYPASTNFPRLKPHSVSSEATYVPNPQPKESANKLLSKLIPCSTPVRNSNIKTTASGKNSNVTAKTLQTNTVRSG